jgi:hypothetical protein
MEEKVDRITADTLLVRPMSDRYVADDMPPLAARLGAPMVEVEGGLIPLPDHMPERFAEIVLDHLRQPTRRRTSAMAQP